MADGQEKFGFQAEVGRLLDLVAHSLYSDKTVALRELVSNAADACDKLRYLALTQPSLIEGAGEFAIRIAVDAKNRRLTVSDNGIGMSREELIDNLGTIARSGTAAFLKEASAEATDKPGLIGQFGVGFYAAFMIADRVEVASRRAGEAEGWRWESDGKGEFALAPTERGGHGSDVILHLKADADQFLDEDALRRIVAKYSDHIGLPIMLAQDGKEEKINAAAALWTRPKSEITPAQYEEFYRHAAHAFDKPWATIHWQAEGVIDYRALLFVPTAKPFDLFEAERTNRLKLYVRRVFITDRCDELLPPWLRFLRGVVDSEDLPLNISREMLQHNPLLAKIRAGIVKRALGELEKKAKDAPEDYAAFWSNFGAVLKEGLYEQNDQADALLGLARFRSSASEGLISLADYLERMKPGQDAIYLAHGETPEAAAKSPHLEGFAARGVEVLLMGDPIDEFWVPAVGAYKDKPLRSVTRGAAELEKFPLQEGVGATPPAEPSRFDGLIALFKLTLGEAVKDVRLSQRLAGSAVCLVADEGDLDINIERLLRQHRRIEEAAKRILELNPRHELLIALADRLKAGDRSAAIADAAWLLLDQARLIQGEGPADTAAFAQRQSAMIARALG